MLLICSALLSCYSASPLLSVLPSLTVCQIEKLHKDLEALASPAADAEVSWRIGRLVVKVMAIHFKVNVTNVVSSMSDDSEDTASLFALLDGRPFIRLLSSAPLSTSSTSAFGWAAQPYADVEGRRWMTTNSLKSKVSKHTARADSLPDSFSGWLTSLSSYPVLIFTLLRTPSLLPSSLRWLRRRASPRPPPLQKPAKARTPPLLTRRSSPRSVALHAQQAHMSALKIAHCLPFLSLSGEG